MSASLKEQRKAAKATTETEVHTPNKPTQKVNARPNGKRKATTDINPKVAKMQVSGPRIVKMDEAKAMGLKTKTATKNPEEVYIDNVMCQFDAAIAVCLQQWDKDEYGKPECIRSYTIDMNRKWTADDKIQNLRFKISDEAAALLDTEHEALVDDYLAHEKFLALNKHLDEGEDEDTLEFNEENVILKPFYNKVEEGEWAGNYMEIKVSHLPAFAKFSLSANRVPAKKVEDIAGRALRVIAKLNYVKRSEKDGNIYHNPYWSLTKLDIGDKVGEVDFEE
jgi:mRNA-degrading endonuclease HigB of HigAB toxin-antitoxin module